MLASLHRPRNRWNKQQNGAGGVGNGGGRSGRRARAAVADGESADCHRAVLGRRVVAIVRRLVHPVELAGMASIRRVPRGLAVGGLRVRRRAVQVP